MENLKIAIEKCKTAKQVYMVLQKYKKNIIKDNTSDYNGRLSIWIDDKTRIYQSSKGMVYQTWKNTEVDYISQSIIDEATNRIIQFVKKHHSTNVLFSELDESEKYEFVLTSTYQNIKYNNPLMNNRMLIIRAIKNADASKENDYVNWKSKTLIIL